MKNALKIALLLITVTFISCSKDSDNTPEASEVTVTTSNFSVTIDENPSEAQLIGTVTGTTNQGTVTFSITEQTPSGAFTIDAASGELKVANETLFDFETNPTISGTVKVANGAVSENASVIISVDDLYEEHIYEGTIFLTTQEEINDFGANNYTHITETLFIGGVNQSAVFNDLTPLSSIKHLGIGLNVYDNNGLTSLTGLENIETLNRLHIINNDLLADISALSNITELPLDIRVDNNPALTNLNGLHNITSFGDLIINNNSALLNLDDLNITTVTYSIEITENPLITNLNSLSNISIIYRDLIISQNNSLTDIDGLSNLGSIYGFVTISQNDSLTDINGLTNLTLLEQELTINSNATLTDLCGLQNLLTNGGLSGDYTVVNNAYNPTEQDVIDGNCSI